MNERIKELYGLAVEHTESMDNGKRSQKVLNEICAEKFAELIIKECIMLLYEDDGATHHEELILEHFGVKNG